MSGKRPGPPKGWLPDDKWPKGTLDGDTLARILAHWPGDPRLWVLEGDHRSTTGDLDGAHSAWRKALALFHGYEDAIASVREKIAAALWREGKTEAARLELRRAADGFAKARRRAARIPVPAYVVDVTMREAIIRAAIGDVDRARALVAAVEPGEFRDAVAADVAELESDGAEMWALSRMTTRMELTSEPGDAPGGSVGPGIGW